MDVPNPDGPSGLLLALLGASAVFYTQIAGYAMARPVAVVALFFLPYLLLRHRQTGSSSRLTRRAIRTGCRISWTPTTAEPRRRRLQ